jgi:16S rRNA (guanine(527)-N(7))-methyltransferase RsmG
MNLTSIRSPEEIVVRHYCESLFFGAQLPEAPAGTRIADIGSGAGFPGVPMAILRPDWRLTLIESHQRKGVFLRESTRALSNLTIIAQRAEQVAERFDWLVGRAIAANDVLALIPKLANQVGLLIGTTDFEGLTGHGGFTWSKTIAIPWSSRTLCVFGIGYRST